ncbi:MAG TPA: dihydrofolate reductase family protein [Allosphingosinicella sp.]
MRKIIVGAFVSLDGVMQAPGGPEEDPTGGFNHGGWVAVPWDQAMGEAMGALFTEPYDLLLGRKTYEIFAAHWPYSDEEPIASQFNKATKFVATSSPRPLAWQNSVAISGDVPAEIARLKEGDGPTLIVQGSTVLIQTLLEHGLVDEFRLLIFPLLLGAGKKLFGEGTIPGALKLSSSRTSSTGVVMATYLPDGAVRTGSFQLPEATEAELARREAIREQHRVDRAPRGPAVSGGHVDPVLA